MWRYLGLRLVVLVATFFTIVTLSFFLMRLAPGGPFDGERRLPPEVEANLRAAYHLDEPLVQQYVRYVAQIVRAGQEAGELRRELDANVVCLAFIGALETMITSQVLKVMRFPEQSQAEDERRVNTVVELFLGGLAARSRS